MVALKAFYDALDGPNWTNETTNNNKWFEDCDPCELDDGTKWHGINCEYGQVTAINFATGNNLSGFIPPEIADLHFLALLNLSGAPITGGIPPEICQLHDLVTLALGNCGLTGTVPSCITDLENLEAIFLQLNKLTGTLPAFGEDNPALHILVFYSNQLSGPIPPSWSDLTPTQISIDNNTNLSGAYDPLLGQLCQYGFTNEYISDGNNFPVPWQTFCSVPSCYIPDDNFELALQALGYDSGPLDDYVPLVNIEMLTSLDVSNQGIEDLKGIKCFAALEFLDCSNNNLEYIDLNDNTALTCLNASNNVINCLNLGFDNLPNLMSSM